MPLAEIRKEKLLMILVRLDFRCDSISKNKKLLTKQLEKGTDNSGEKQVLERSHCKDLRNREFPGRPVVRRLIQYFHCCDLGSIPGQRTKIPKAMRPKKKKKKKVKEQVSSKEMEIVCVNLIFKSSYEQEENGNNWPHFLFH